MKRKEISDFTVDEKNWMDTLAVNYVVAQSDGFQLGYAQAISDFKEYIVDYWNGGDDKAQQSVLDALVDLGVELRKRQETVEKNIETAKEMGYEDIYYWRYKEKNGLPTAKVKLFTKDYEKDGEEDECEE